MGFTEVELPFSAEQAATEGNRCLHCDQNIFLDGERCILCGGCVDICPYQCIAKISASRVDWSDAAGDFPAAAGRGEGYAMVLDREAESGRAIDPDALYTYDPERGPVALEGRWAELQLSGSTLLDLARDEFGDPRTLAQSKALMKALITHRLDFQPLNSRRIFRELLEL